ncbi:MAG TPA: TauD/TfdA family dioxygenase [Ramlibacter sp.]|nr:TauD/TfdA family dioxygenase [Ramlibacter sp.]
MNFKTRRLTPNLGIEITGLDLSRPVDAATRKALHDHWVDGAVLVIRDQKLSPPEFEALARQFGEPMEQQVKKLVVEDHPLVGTLSSRDLPMVDGKLHVRGENYHTDHSNFPAPPKATMLHAVELPSKGGDTQFVDVRQAYDELPDAMKKKILPLFSHHVFESSNSPRKMVPLPPEEMAKIPHTVHPLVIRHPDTGRAALYLNTGRMEGIEGMGKEEAYALIDSLYAHATQSRYEYRHQWKYGDVVIWDNRSVMHQANADFDPTENRFLYRIMLHGAPLQAYSSPSKQVELA